LAGLIVALLGVLVFGPDRFLPGAGDRSTPDQLGVVLNPSLSDRVEIWSRAVDGLQDFPLTGMGLGMFRYVMPVFYPLFTVSPEVDLGHAHNEWLQTGTDLGFPGLVVFVATQGLGIWLAYALFRAEIWCEVRWLMAGIFAGFVAQIVFGLTDAVALGAKPGIFWWLLLGLVAATWQVFKEAGPEAPTG
jgi:putative inorganic carbon (HCO3(-)) transporter